MSKADKYSELFNKDYLMGPNSVRLLEEMLSDNLIKEEDRVLDLGCGKGLTSLFIAKETNAQVFATDLWISATENYENFKKWSISDKVIPVHADANDLPYADEFFDVIVSIDSFHYFANQKGFFDEKVLPLVKKNGIVIIAMPGLKDELHGSLPLIIEEWINGEDNEFELYHSREWWKDYFGRSDAFEIVKDFELECFDLAWKDWFMSEHLFSIRDAEYFAKGVDEYLEFVGFVIRKI